MTQATAEVDLLIHGGPVLTMDGERRFWPSGSIAVDGAMIVATGPSSDMRERFVAREVVEAPGMAVLPGFVSCHGHAGLSLLRGLAELYPLEPWLWTAVWPLMRHADQDDTYAGAQLACLEMLQSGITTFADMWRDLPATVEAVDRSGLRARLAFNMRDFDDPAELESEWEQGFAAIETASPTPRIGFGLAPHSLYACSDPLLRRVGAAVAQRQCHLQIHLAETAAEVRQCRERHGMGPVERLEELGLIGPDLLVAHGVWLDERDCTRLAAGGASVSHNISSNLKLASGVAPLGRFRKSGLNFGLGTDSAASNNVLDPFREMRMAALMQRGAGINPASLAYDMLEAATRNGAAALGLADQVGSIEAGKRADLVLVDLDKPHLGPRLRNDRETLARLLVFAAGARDVDSVAVDGRFVMRGRQVLTLDVEAVHRAALASLERLVARAGHVCGESACHCHADEAGS